MTGQPSGDTFQWCFSTLGCPELLLPDAIALASEFRLPAIELRSLGGTVDLPRLFSEKNWTSESVTQLTNNAGVRLAVAGSSFKLTSTSETDRDELIAFSTWADSLRIPFVRVFGGGQWGDTLAGTDFQNAARNVEWWRAEKKSRRWRTELLLETHDAFSGSAPCLELNGRLSEPIGIIWDSHHTWRYAGESPNESWNRLGQWVRHVHIKDSISKPSARHPFTYVLPGDGEMPMADVIAILRREEFDGAVSLEWEKLWHPEIAEPEIALADYVNTMSQHFKM